jgi:hypothetical protein
MSGRRSTLAFVLMLAAVVLASLACVAPASLAAARAAASPGETVTMAADNPNPPASPVKLIFIHHSCGENWLEDGNGKLGIALRDGNYFVSDTNYGWGPDGIGSDTDIGHWWSWFRGPSSSAYTSALYAESGQNSSYSRLAADPGGENEIVMFKSCYPNSAIGGSPSDPVPPIASNPLAGNSSPLTVANAKGIYIDILEYFETRPDKLFIVITAPPLQDGTYAANARAFNNWLVNDWLDGYPLSNVFVFDFYNVLSSNGGSAYASDLGWDTGNHHRWWNGAIQHKTDGGGNTLAYPSGGDDHPNYVGNQKATGEFVALLNVAYNRFKGSANAPAIDGINPATGVAGTLVTITGSRFGTSRGSSYVSFGAVQATDYPEWTDTRIRCRVPAGALSGMLTVTTADGGESNGVNFVVPLPEVNSTFYFAEGYTGSGFEEWLCLLNRDNGDAIAQVTYLYADGSQPFTVDHPLPANSRTTINVNQEAGADKEVSIKLESDGIILAERPIYFSYLGRWDGGHDVIGALAPSTEWFFAEGYTGPGFDEYICALNPTGADATLTFRFQTAEAGEQLREGYGVPAHSRRTFNVNDVLGGAHEASLAVESSQPVVVERPMYFDYLSTDFQHWEGGHCVIGATQLSAEFYFAEGTTRSGFESWITLQNPHDHDIIVDAVYQLGEGQGSPRERSYDVPAGFRRTVFVRDEVGAEKDVSVALSSEETFLAERPVYFSYRYGELGARGGHCVIGAIAPAQEWLLAEGFTGGGFQQWLCLQNPGDTDASVEVTYYTQEEGVLPVKAVNVPARTRVTLMVNEHAGSGYQLSTRVRVTSGPDIVVERPMYFDYGSGWDGGHDVVGYVPES